MPNCVYGKENFTTNHTRLYARWLILLFACWISFGNFYAYDNPSALNLQLQAYLDIPEEIYGFQFMLLYAIYSVPNILIPFLIGGFLDIYGTNMLCIILGIFVCLGQAIFAIGGQLKNLPIMLLGRFIFGLGGESLTVAQARLITDWFSGSELCLAIGVTLAMSRAGLVCNNVLSPIFHDIGSLPIALWAGFGFCILSFIFSTISVILNMRLCYVRVSPRCEDPSCQVICGEPVSAKPLTVKELLASTPVILKTFHPAIFLLCGISFIMNGSIIPFNNIASDFLQKKWYPGSTSKASWAMSIPDSIAIFLIPIFGYIIDLYGYKVVYLLGSGFALGIGHFLMACNISSPIFPLIINGLASSAIVAIWPCIPALVPEAYWATAYGLITACINASYMICPAFVAIIASYDRMYIAVEIFFSLQAIIGAFLSILFDISRKTIPSPVLPPFTLEKIPRAPTFSGPPESLFVLINEGGNTADSQSEWDSYYENICSYIENCEYPHRYKCLEEDPIIIPGLSQRIPVRFRDDSQIEEKICTTSFCRRRCNSVLGI